MSDIPDDMIPNGTPHIGENASPTVIDDTTIPTTEPTEPGNL